ncbi:transposase [Variovorax sp. MHTC-1]|uniref:IS66 family transposase n=1 Tax=Variovorax sp. MHTC-1 TaxID=2495593 RepID=UPI00163CA6E4|nr:transposase [Variovorax sp. MHTC-1]
MAALPCSQRAAIGSEVVRHHLRRRVLLSVLQSQGAHLRQSPSRLLDGLGHGFWTLQRIAQIYRVERELAEMPAEERLAERMNIARPLWEQLQAWLRLERGRVPDGSATAKALNYSLNAWEALTRNLLDGDVPVDNNHCENLIRPWAMTCS